MAGNGMAGNGAGGRRNRFAATCALMRQYMRQNQRQVQMGNVARVFQAPPPSPVPAESEEREDRTMQLFPVHAGATMAPPPQAQERPEVNKAPMTIFYGGQVVMFDEFPADRANQLLQIAGSSVTAPPLPPENVVVVDVPDDVPEPVAEADQPAIARKASLQRFLRKRKHRVNGADAEQHNEEAPWPAKKIDAGGSQMALEDVPDALWLRL